MRTLIWIAALALPLQASAQDAYKCRSSDGVIYQNFPCAEETIRVYFEPAATRPERPPQDIRLRNEAQKANGYLSDRAKERQLNALKSEIARIEDEIAVSEDSMHRELAALDSTRGAYGRSADSLADPVARNISMEMQAIRSRYMSEISVKQDRIKILQNEIANSR